MIDKVTKIPKIMRPPSLKRLTALPSLHGSLILFVCLKIERQRLRDRNDRKTFLFQQLQSCCGGRAGPIDAVHFDPMT